MKKIYISIFLISQLISCNRHRETEIPSAGRFNPEIIYVDKFQEPLPWHEFADTLFVVPLETNDNRIISKITRITYRQDKFFIHDQSQQALYVFDQNGNYLNKLDKQGKGPGEYLDLRDFKIDSKGHIYILTYNKVQIYSPDLEFIDDINFNVVDSNGDLFGAVNFAFAGNNGFYLWRGSFGIHEKPGNLSYSMVKIDLEGKILARYFPVEK